MAYLTFVNFDISMYLQTEKMSTKNSSQIEKVIEQSNLYCK